MARITAQDLDRIGEEAKSRIHLRQGIARGRILVHMGTCGIAAGARAVMMALIREVETRHLGDIALVTSSCAGLCSREPMITVELKDQPPVKYVNLTADKVKDIVEKHILGGEIAAEHALSVGSERVL
ncbi:MAG: (2Fe-2S) ferredoxin domain-containing protein [Planctomycetes bacterium]|nr:(2Fe-2S) ferredoxin domain-containing protein [Planctomycetota bacterium]